jgi:hypothetical protein
MGRYQSTTYMNPTNGSYIKSYIMSKSVAIGFATRFDAQRGLKFIQAQLNYQPQQSKLEKRVEQLESDLKTEKAKPEKVRYTSSKMNRMKRHSEGFF